MSSNRLAPEWERQDAIIIVWPHLYSDWANNLDAIENTYFEFCKHICKYEHLILVAYNHAHLLHIQQKLDEKAIGSKNILFTINPTNDTWVRDYGPICVNSNNGLLALDFEFDAWGQKFNYNHDNAFNSKLIEQLNFKVSYQHIEQVLEAGNIDINNRGELLCSNSCFKRKVYTPPIDLTYLEKQFTNWFGCSTTYWIDEVQLKGDDTDGHIDTLARFCTDDMIVYSSKGNPNDVNNESLNLLATQLESIRKQSNNRLDIMPLPLPDPIFLSGKQLPATYTNFLITNETVLVPVFEKNNRQNNYVLKVFDELFPTREVIDMDSTTLIQQFGGLHCATMQIPKGILK